MNQQDRDLSEFDKSYGNDDEDLTITDIEAIKKDTSGPWATTASTESLIHIRSRGGKSYDLEDIVYWAEHIPGFKSRQMMYKTLGDAWPTEPGKWVLSLETKIWHN